MYGFDHDTIAVRDNHGNEYAAQIQLEQHTGRPMIRVIHTPGNWYADTIDDIDGPLAIDFGNGWFIPADDATRIARLARAAIAEHG